MSDADPHVQDSKFDIVDVDVRAWVEAARANPSLYRDRQVTEIVLGAIGLAPSLSKTLVLKGGAVMALAFNSNQAWLSRSSLPGAIGEEDTSRREF